MLHYLQNSPKKEACTVRNDLSTEKESDIPTPAKKNPLTSLSYTRSRCFGMTIICLVVALAVTMGLVACERMEAEPSPTETPPDTTETAPFTHRDNLFTFGYDPYLGNLAYHGSLIYLNTWVINEGDPFTYEGSSRGFAPTAALVHKENGYRIQGNFATTMDLVRITINTGDKGQAGQVFQIPNDAPTGVYNLELSFGGESATLPGVLTVAIP